jgi:hypothetical protein
MTKRQNVAIAILWRPPRPIRVAYNAAMRLLSAVRLLLALHVAILGLGCATPEPPPVRETVKPIALGPEGSRPLVFLHVVERMPAGMLLGIAHWENSDVPLDEIRASGSSNRSKSYNVSITNLLRGNGYTVLDEADVVFSPDRTVKVRYQLAGVIHGGDVDFSYTRSRSRKGKPPPPVARGEARVDFELQVYDTVARRPVFKRR